MKKTMEPNPWLFPVPAILVSCKGGGGKPNIITLAWCGVAASVPPMVSIGIRPSRYSHDLIMASQEFVINIPSRKLARAVDLCGNISGRKTDKFKAAGLTAAAAKKVKAPVIKECPVNLECQVRKTLTLGTHTHFLAEVVAVQVEAGVLDAKGKPDMKKLDPIAFCPMADQYYALGKALGRHGFSKKK